MRFGGADLSEFWATTGFLLSTAFILTIIAK